MIGPLRVRRLPGLQDYVATWQAMRAFTDARGPEADDELWLLEHKPVFTLGQAGREEHVLDPRKIPVIKSDRGGQVTYHGPGQLVAYLMLDLRRAGIGVRRLVNLLEQSVVDLLAGHGIAAAPRPDAPGVYVDGAKIASLGLRIRNGCSYHGLALNVSMDLEPFARINPCGFAGLQVTQVSALDSGASLDSVATGLAGFIAQRLALRPLGVDLPGTELPNSPSPAGGRGPG